MQQNREHTWTTIKAILSTFHFFFTLKFQMMCKSQLKKIKINWFCSPWLHIFNFCVISKLLKGN